MKRQILGLMATALVSSSVMAEGAYIGFDVGMSQLEIKPDDSSDTYKAEPLTLRVKGGGFINRYFAIEGYMGFGIDDDTVEDTDLDIGLENIIGIDAIGVLPLGDVASAYGKVGVVGVSYDDEDNDRYRENGLAYGVGAKLNVGGSGAVTLDYTVLPDIESDEYGFTVESAIISIGYQFNM